MICTVSADLHGLQLVQILQTRADAKVWVARAGARRHDIYSWGDVDIRREAGITKTLVDIDDATLARALALSGIATKKGVIAVALEQMVRRLELDQYTEFARSGALDDLADPEVTRSAQR